MNEQINAAYEWTTSMDGWADGCLNGQPDRQMENLTDQWIDGWINIQMDRQMDRRMNGCTDMSSLRVYWPIILQGFPQSHLMNLLTDVSNIWGSNYW